ncbi:MAG: thiamine diphosphokinase [Eubacterium sp.]|nr:thiamine diphosphokinase [Eubacterium sp.]
MKKIMIITSYIEGDKEEINSLIKNTDCDYIICADGGYDYAMKAHITPDLLVGDFDSSKTTLPDDIETIVVPVEKDDTDLQLALKIAIEKGAEEILIIGGIGGRVDHTIGNIQNIVHYSTSGPRIEILDPNQSITVHHPGTYTYRGKEGMTFSAFAYTPEVTGVTYHGAYYPLDNHTLTNTFPLGISNHFLGEEITVTTKSGILIIVRTLL